MNPLKRTNSSQDLNGKKDTPFDAYSFYMFHVKEKPIPKPKVDGQLVKGPASPKKQLLLELKSREEIYVDSIDKKRMARKTNLWAQRRGSGTINKPLTIQNSITPSASAVALPPLSSDEPPKSEQMQEIEKKISEFIVQDELLDLQIQKATDRDQKENLQKERDDRKMKVEEYKKKLLIAAKEEQK